MDMGFLSRPRLIDRLRLFEILRPHLGEKDATATANALQDEFSATTTHHDIQVLMVWLRAELNALAIKILFGTATIVGLAVAIAELT